MSNSQPKNIVASVHQRLLNLSKQSGRRFNDLALHYAIERFLYRLSQSPYSQNVILKGGLMLNVWKISETRMTRDIDLLGRLSNDLEEITKVVKNICLTEVENDGLTFDSENVTTHQISEDADYHGVRVKFNGYLGKMVLPMQIDFGFSDIVMPAPSEISYPTLLDHPPAQLLAYNQQTVIAEKFEAMIKLGELNSRMRDFYDIWQLAQNFTFDEQNLRESIQSAFTQRGTKLELAPACFSARFFNDPQKKAQWQAFLKTAQVSNAPSDFLSVVRHVREFINPVVNGIVEGCNSNRRWKAGGTWE